MKSKRINSKIVLVFLLLLSLTNTVKAGVPVTGLLICCRGAKGPYLINDKWVAKHDYNDISQVRGILTNIKNAGIKVVMIDMSNASQWTKFKDIFFPMIENIRTVTAELGMEYFILIGANLSQGTKDSLSDIEWIQNLDHLEFWNHPAEIIWKKWAQDSHYRSYGFGDNRKMLNLFWNAVDVDARWEKAPAAHKTYLSYFYRGTHEFNEDYPDTETSGWGYRDVQQNKSGSIRFVSPTSGLHPNSSSFITEQKWKERVDWAAQASHYSIYSSYDDGNDNIQWGINDTKNVTIPGQKYVNDDPYVYYNVVKNKLANKAPQMSFISPKETNFPVGTSLGVTVDATDDGSIANVKLYINDVFVRQEESRRYDWGTANTDNEDPALLNLAAGTYVLRAVATDNNGLTSEKTLTIKVSGILSVKDFEKDAINIYPNPSEDGIFYLNDEMDFEVYDIKGRIIEKKKSSKIIDLSSRSKGIYILKVGKSRMKIIR